MSRTSPLQLTLAYVVATAGLQEVVFAISSGQARELFSEAAGVGLEAVTSCARAPWADQYAADRRVPARVRVAHGLSVACACCGAAANDGPGACFDEYQAYCSQECLIKHDEQIQAREVALLEAREVALALWPEARVVKVEELGGRCRVHFMFGSPERHAFWFADDDQVQVAPVDIEAWADFNRRMRLSRQI